MLLGVIASQARFVPVSSELTLAPAVANLLLSTTAPTVEISEVTTLSPDTANLVLSTTAPTLAQTAHVDLSPASASLALSTTAPIVETGSVSLSPASANLVVSGTAPAIAIESTLWTPTALGAGFLLGLKGDSLSGSDGDNIAAWNDWSGNGRNFTQATEADKPNLEVAELNGMNVVHFTGSNTEFLDGASLSGVATSASLFYVVKATTNDSGAGGPGMFGTSASSNHYTFTDVQLYNGDLSTTRKSCGNPTPSVANWNILSIASASADWKCRLGGTQQFTTATNTVGFATTPQLGRSLAQYFTGDIAEVVLMDGINTTNRDKVEGYLAHRWGIAAILDAGHPYKSTPPTI